MKHYIKCSLLAACWVGILGCQGNPNAAASSIDSTSTTMDSLSNNVQGSKVPSGDWITAMASDAVMTARLQGKQLHVHWAASIDTDFLIEGEVTEKGAGVYGGKLNLASGDADAHPVDATLRFDPHGQTLTLQMPVMWEDTVVFRRAPAAAVGCAAAGESVVERTEMFKAFAQKINGLGLMDETEDANDKVQDYQLYETIDDAIRTLARLRVDFDKKVVLEYDAAEDSYNPIEGSAALFEGVQCK